MQLINYIYACKKTSIYTTSKQYDNKLNFSLKTAKVFKQIDRIVNL
jgi:hypothetical protein